MIWAAAEGCRVVDSNGREYLDLSGGFGVAALGHRNPAVAAAMGRYLLSQDRPLPPFLARLTA